MSSEIEHLLVRFSDRWAPPEGTIAAHQSVLAKLGFVWVAKFGRTIGLSRIRALQAQIDSGMPTFVVLLTSTQKFSMPGSVRGAAFRIDRVQANKPENTDSGIPVYYAGLPLPSATWFRARTCVPLKQYHVDGMRVWGSGKGVMGTLTSSMAGAFRLRIAEPVLDDLEHAKSETQDR